MSDEPKPCPFCGEPAEIDLSRGFRAFASGNMESQVAIYCTKCSCDMTMCYSDFPEYDVDQLRAILLGEWNRRVPTPAVPDDVAGLIADLRRSITAHALGNAAADALEAQAAELARLQGRLRMIVSHATMGTTDGEGQSTNDICVQITALRNELYQDAKAAALTQPTGDRP